MLPERSRQLRFALLLATTGVASTQLGGCALGYYAQAARGQWQLQRAREPIGAVIADDRRPKALRERLALLREAREFAVTELALPDNASYRSYADIGRPYVVWNVVATGEFALEPRRWCFPIVGCLAYRGYFRESAARRMAARLSRRGDDVAVGGVAAYSTLGRFADPVPSSMLRYSDATVIGIMFHELAHQVVYVAGDTAFNEAYASVVEQAGISAWLGQRRPPQAVIAWQEEQVLQRRFEGLVAAARDDLAALYAGGGTPETLRTAKAGRLAMLAVSVGELRRGGEQESAYAAWLEGGLNNARLAAVTTYSDCVPALRRLLDEQGGDLRRFHEAVRKLAARDQAARSSFCARIDGGTDDDGPGHTATREP
ncbi:MAG: aminopeptidase [Steroidobacteraceae bacterium]